MATGKITKRTVDALRPNDKDSYLWDGGHKDSLAGFGVKVTPTGRKVYLIQYRLGGRRGRTRRVTIGTHGSLTAEKARGRAKTLLGQVASGIDPASERDRAKAAERLGDVLNMFLDEHVDAKLKASTVLEYRRTANLYIGNELRRRPIGEVSRTEIARLHHDLRAQPYQANRLLAFLSRFFNWCEQHGLRPDNSNPCRHVTKYPEHKRERFLSADELARLGDALRSAEADKMASAWVIAAIRLLALTGARLNEVLTLQWENVDLEHNVLRIADSKTGKKTIQLTAAAAKVLQSVPRVEGNPYVIAGQRNGQHLVNLGKPWRLIRKTAKLDGVRLHDLRHSFASMGALGGLSLPVIGALLGHSQPQTTARYAHLADEPVKAAANIVADRIEAALDGKDAGVVSLRRKRDAV